MCPDYSGFSFLNQTALSRVSEMWKDSRSEACFVDGENDIEKMTKWTLLDNKSTVDIFCDSRPSQDIHEVGDTMTVETNGGILVCTKQGFLKGYGWVWCHPDAIADVLCLKNVEK